MQARVFTGISTTEDNGFQPLLVRLAQVATHWRCVAGRVLTGESEVSGYNEDWLRTVRGSSR